MNALEQLLQDDLNHLIDRIAAATREGVVADGLARRADLVPQLHDAEARLSRVRLALLGGYAAWREALEACGDLWALADLTDEPAELAPGQRRAA
ncbi:MAG TPA: hypothetical protein VGT40_17930 [Methylomirabilota bacterium]|nr:hypothetical protein [Methylomirabilota bacterium]